MRRALCAPTCLPHVHATCLLRMHHHQRCHPGSPGSLRCCAPLRHRARGAGRPRRLGLDSSVVAAARASLDTSVAVADTTIKDLEEARTGLEDEEAAR